TQPLLKHRRGLLVLLTLLLTQPANLRQRLLVLCLGFGTLQLPLGSSHVQLEPGLTALIRDLPLLLKRQLIRQLRRLFSFLGFLGCFLLSLSRSTLSTTLRLLLTDGDQQPPQRLGDQRGCSEHQRPREPHVHRDRNSSPRRSHPPQEGRLPRHAGDQQGNQYRADHRHVEQHTQRERDRQRDRQELGHRVRRPWQGEQGRHRGNGHEDLRQPGRCL